MADALWWLGQRIEKLAHRVMRMANWTKQQSVKRHG